jgi:hypothetical protein
MGGASLDLSLRVKDSWKQKDLPDYIGKIMCNTLDEDGSQVELVISLPKVVALYFTLLNIYHSLINIHSKNT